MRLRGGEGESLPCNHNHPLPQKAAGVRSTLSAFAELSITVGAYVVEHERYTGGGRHVDWSQSQGRLELDGRSIGHRIACCNQRNVVTLSTTFFVQCSGLHGRFSVCGSQREQHPSMINQTWTLEPSNGWPHSLNMRSETTWFTFGTPQMPSSALQPSGVRSFKRNASNREASARARKGGG